MRRHDVASTLNTTSFLLMCLLGIGLEQNYGTRGKSIKCVANRDHVRLCIRWSDVMYTAILGNNKGFDQAVRICRQASQWAFGAKMTSYPRRCDVITSYRRGYDVILSPNAHWPESLLVGHIRISNGSRVDCISNTDI